MTMLDYTMEQPEILRKVLKQNVEIMVGFEEVLDGKKPDHVYLTTSGTSCNAAKAAAPFMEHVLEQEVSVFPPSQIERVFGEGPLLIFISRGGEPTNMIVIVEKMKGYPRIAMTGNADGRINSICEYYIMTPYGDEAVRSKTEGYTVMILTPYLMALEAARKAGSVTEEEYREYLATLETPLVQYQENIERARRWTEKNEEGSQTLKEIYLVGKGQNMFATQEGALKMMETYLIPGLSYDLKKYPHGPSCSIREVMGGMYLLPMMDDGDYERMQKLVAYYRGICGQAHMVSLPTSEDERDCTLLNSEQWYTKPFKEMLPLQTIYVVILGKLGINGAGMQHFKEIDEFMDVRYKEDIKQVG